MNKIKVIDLLNMISREEEVPYSIKYNGRIYEYADEIKWYLRDDMKCELTNSKLCLNDEVEIIEKRKIPEKLGYFDLTKDKNEKDENGDNLELRYTGVADTFDDVYEKINEIIDYLKSKGE